MSALLAVLGVLAFCCGVVAEQRGLVAAPGFALAAGTLLAIYLWFLARARRSTEASRRRNG